MERLVYYNGEIKPYDEVKIDLEDRGYLFADGVYEVINVYNGQPFKMEEHFQRLKNSVEGLKIIFEDYKKLKEQANILLKKNDFKDASLYIQITRGTAPRSHAYPDGMEANVMMIVKKLKRNPDSYYENGIKIITVADERWPRAYIKSISLLPNILAKKKAKNEGAFEAVQIRDGFITEGTSSNIFIVKDDKVITPPASNYILNGISRRVVLDICVELKIEYRERGIAEDELYSADEVFLSGTTTEVMPVAEINNYSLGNGSSGNISRRIFKFYRNLLG